MIDINKLKTKALGEELDEIIKSKSKEKYHGKIISVLNMINGKIANKHSFKFDDNRRFTV